jgi:hypothetical protein
VEHWNAKYWLSLVVVLVVVGIVPHLVAEGLEVYFTLQFTPPLKVRNMELR